VIELSLQRPDEADHGQPLRELPTGGQVVLGPLRIDHGACGGFAADTVKICQELFLAAVLGEKYFDQRLELQ
jgi:hypothetical protein